LPLGRTVPILQLRPLSLAAMAKPRGAPQLLYPRHRRLLRSPISRCACLFLAFAALLLVSSLHQVVRVDLLRPDPPHQARFAILPSFWLLVACCLLRFHCTHWLARHRFFCVMQLLNARNCLVCAHVGTQFNLIFLVVDREANNNKTETDSRHCVLSIYAMQHSNIPIDLR
jgi:hypothetical protein